jgi:hypothetical protein
MNFVDFNSKLMDIRIVFNEKEIKPGSLIKVYKLNSPDYEGGNDSTFQHMGIVERVDFSLIKYHYYSVGKQEVIHHFLYPSDIYNGENEGRFLFEVV